MKALRLLLTCLLLMTTCPALADAPPPLAPRPGQPFAPWLGRSGRLRALFVRTGAEAQELIERLLPTATNAHLGRKPGTWSLGLFAPDGAPLTLVTLVPFEDKRGSRLGSYRIGRWPQELKGSPNGYARPDGFVRVTREQANTPVSSRFRLKDFLTKDQADVWPKYLVLRAPMVDKLELIADALKAAGRPDSVRIMSGFRTPSYNARGVGAGGRAEDSRHIYGDASDIFVDADGSGSMDDLDGDGRVTLEDARWLKALVEGVETDHPELVGGLSAYPATSEHGPFVHVDVRGRAARW